MTVRRLRTSLSGACIVNPVGGASFGPIFHDSQIVKMSQLGSTSFGELLWGFGVQNGVLRARVSFGIQSYVYIGLGLLSGKNLKTVWTLLKTLLFEITRVITFYP